MDRSCPHHATRKTGKNGRPDRHRWWWIGIDPIVRTVWWIDPFRSEKRWPTQKKGEEQGVLIKVTHFFGGDQIFTHVLGILRDFPYSCALFGWECNDCWGSVCATIAIIFCLVVEIWFWHEHFEAILGGEKVPHVFLSMVGWCFRGETCNAAMLYVDTSSSSLHSSCNNKLWIYLHLI